jgi:hypothetical protein
MLQQQCINRPATQADCSFLSHPAGHSLPVSSTRRSEVPWMQAGGGAERQWPEAGHKVCADPRRPGEGVQPGLDAHNLSRTWWQRCGTILLVAVLAAVASLRYNFNAAAAATP